jgi:hypothetical protein
MVVCGPACARAGLPKQSRALTPGQRRREAATPCSYTQADSAVGTSELPNALLRNYTGQSPSETSLSSLDDEVNVALDTSE